jgi:uncharacterized membrane protein YfcA
MIYLVICSVAFLASGLTFYSGFGLGTLLLPAFAIFFPVELAVASTAVVHFLNNLFKLLLVGRHADREVVLRFGITAVVFSLLGAWLLVGLADVAPLLSYTAFGRQVAVTPVNVVVGALLLLFAALEWSPTFRQVSFGPRFMPLGGALSGFFGGLSGMQGALRSAFLVRAGLTKEAFIGSGVVIACLIDASRLSVYTAAVARERAHLDYGLLGAAVAAAFLGAYLGNRHLGKVTMPGVQRFVAIALAAVAIGLLTGLI